MVDRLVWFALYVVLCVGAMAIAWVVATFVGAWWNVSPVWVWFTFGAMWNDLCRYLDRMKRK